MGIVTYETPSGEKRRLEDNCYDQIQHNLLQDAVPDDAIVDVGGVKVRVWGMLRKRREFISNPSFHHLIFFSNTGLSYIALGLRINKGRSENLSVICVIAWVCLAMRFFCSDPEAASSIFTPVKVFVFTMIGLIYWAKRTATKHKDLYKVSVEASKSQAPLPQRYS